ncbi:conserved hypothetical protein [Saccharicrinis carchari]|uniref:Mucoidy inhibitor MuiA family protein n=1 Tax=Saccharicrinis carchari TaxID=1168039 RepID=A0A521DBW4_SACCC|nr:DUF4139 domain-containing protein [Saccharicrinis carchari]SMO69078.1 conserved hypothetical protein [Saccharicrinis carchari]
MKTTFFLIAALIFNSLSAQNITEKEVKTEVDEVTVFIEGAQIVRKKTVELGKGNSIVKFINLSPFINAKSIQVKAQGDLTVLSVNHQQNFLDKAIKSKELMALEKELEAVDEKINLESTHLSILHEELTFLQENRVVGGKNEQVSIVNLQQTANFYGNKLTELKMKEIERNKSLKKLMQKRSDLQSQINTLSGKKEFPSGEVLMKVDAKKSGGFSLELRYIVENAGWFPSYDIRAKNIDKPVQLIYKANVKQDTKVDWKNVKLKFSSADPNVSGVAPQLKTYFINYNSRPPSYKQTANSVSGKVMDSNGEPLPGATVVVTGTTIGTVTDMQGNYSLTIPNNAGQLTYSFIGFNNQTLPIAGERMNVALQENQRDLEEVVVTGYGGKRNVLRALKGKVAGVVVDDEMDMSEIKVRGTSSLAIPMAQVENQTTVDFEIEMPYTVHSDNKNYSVDMAFYDVRAFYQYYAVPKVDKDAFLIANIVGWEKYNLLEGEANVFFEDTYVGKTLMDVRYASDTLEVSLGRDKRVAVNREKVKDFTTKQFIGSKKEETRAWKTTVKNNKNKEINMIVLDQVPVSTIEAIEVDIQNISGAKHNAETGEIKWELKIKPTGQKELDLKYSVKYPKNRNVYVE